MYAIRSYYVPVVGAREEVAGYHEKESHEEGLVDGDEQGDHGLGSQPGHDATGGLGSPEGLGPSHRDQQPGPEHRLDSSQPERGRPRSYNFV